MGVKYGFFTAIFWLLRISSSQAAFISNGSRVGMPCVVSKGDLAQTRSRFMGTQFVSIKASTQKKRTASKGTKLAMFLGSDGGFLGVGAPEVAVIAIVGYFFLGPSELYKISKEIGKFIQNIQTLGTEATKTFENSMEDQLQLEELRKAQNELNNAFNFRRNISVNEAVESFTKPSASVEVDTPTTENTISESATTAPKKRKRKRKRVKKKEEVSADVVAPESTEIPDLEMPGILNDENYEENELGNMAPSNGSSTEETEEEFAARIREERLDRLQNGAPSTNTTPDWFADEVTDMPKEEMNEEEMNEALPSIGEQSRFAAQLSGDWNDHILANEDKLSPLAKVMDRLAILEKEKEAANARLEEEFRLRTEVEEKFYREKRAVLEEAANEISVETYGDFSSVDTQNDKNDSAT